MSQIDAINDLLISSLKTRSLQINRMPLSLVWNSLPTCMGFQVYKKNSKQTHRAGRTRGQMPNEKTHQ